MLLLPRGGHALISDGGREERQKARSRYLSFVFVTLWSNCHVKAVICDCTVRYTVLFLRQTGHMKGVTVPAEGQLEKIYMLS